MAMSQRCDSLEQLSVATKAAHAWQDDGGQSNLEQAHEIYGRFYDSPHPMTGHFASCSLGDLYARNESHRNAHFMLISCLEGLGKQIRDVSDQDESCRKLEEALWEEVNHNIWMAQHAGQLGRLLLRFNQAQAALTTLDKALGLLGVVVPDGSGPAVKASGGIEVDSEDSLLLVAGALSGFKGLAFRVLKDHHASEPFLRRSLRLVDTTVEAAALLAEIGTQPGAATVSALEGKGLRELSRSRTNNRSFEVAESPRRWWGRADVLEMLLNHGDALVRTGKPHEAPATYALGAAAGLFQHAAQRPVHEVRHPATGAALSARPVWWPREGAGRAGGGGVGGAAGGDSAAASAVASHKDRQQRQGSDTTNGECVDGSSNGGGGGEAYDNATIERSGNDDDDDGDETSQSTVVDASKGGCGRSSSQRQRLEEEEEEEEDLLGGVEEVSLALEREWVVIREEALALVNLQQSHAKNEADGKRGGGGIGENVGGDVAWWGALSHRLLNLLLARLGIVSSQAGHGRGFYSANSMLLEPSTQSVVGDLKAWWVASVEHGLPGTWSQFFLYEHGLRDHSNCALAPRTCKLVEALGAQGNLLGDAKFSLMAPGAQVTPHCGPTNGRLRIHLGLSVAPADVHRMGLRVGLHSPPSHHRETNREGAASNAGVVDGDGDGSGGGGGGGGDGGVGDGKKSNVASQKGEQEEQRGERERRQSPQVMRWREGEAFVFDDSFEHSVFHNGHSPRLVLILDVWHPELQAFAPPPPSDDKGDRGHGDGGDENDDHDENDENDDGPSKTTAPITTGSSSSSSSISSSRSSRKRRRGGGGGAASAGAAWTPPSLGPPVTVVRNNVDAYPELAQRLGLTTTHAPLSSSSSSFSSSPPSSPPSPSASMRSRSSSAALGGALSWVGEKVASPEGELAAFLLVAVGLIWGYYRVFLAPQFSRLGKVMDSRRANKEKRDVRAAEMRLDQYQRKLEKEREEKEEKRVAVPKG